jgi:hypothetical protein
MIKEYGGGGGTRIDKEKPTPVLLLSTQIPNDRKRN